MIRIRKRQSMGWSLRTRIAFIIIGVSGLLGLYVQVMAQGQTLYVQSSNANVRKSPEIAFGNILVTLPRGTPVTVADPEGEWYPVQLEDKRQGWMHRSILSAEPPRASAAPTAGLPLLRIGVVIDGPQRTRNVFLAFEQEIRELLRGEYAVRFPAQTRLTADYTTAGVRKAMSRLLADPQVDMVLALGVLASNDAGHRKRLSKPVFAPFVINANLQGLTPKAGSSGVRNLSYFTFPSNVTRYLQAFRNIVAFDKVAFLIQEGFQDLVPELRANIEREIRDLKLAFALVPVGASVQAALDAIPADVQAVYVTPLQHLSPEAFEELAQGLIARRLPSFSMVGRPEVEAGLLASLALATDLNRLARRVALNIQRTLEGENPASFPVTFARRERLTINMATARAIGVSPPWELMTQADLLNEAETETPRHLSLQSAVEEAVNANLDLQAIGNFVAAGRENISEARSFLLPQIAVAADGRIIDSDRAEAGGGAFPERQLSGSINLFQVLYDEPTWANLSIQQSLQTSREEQRELVLLDVVLEAATSYLNVLSARTIEGIQRQNLDLTRTNLELARVRRQIGVARAAEVVRWENQIANNRRTVITAFSQSKQAAIVLNRVLHRPLEEPFRTTEPALDDPSLMTNFAKIFPYVDNPRYFEIFRNFMVEEGLEAAPELRLVDSQIRAQERNLRSTKRAFWSPTVSLRGSLAGVERDGKGDTATRLTIGNQTLQFPQDNSWNWEVGATASLPLTTGGGRRARRNRAREELAQLQVERDATSERVATRIRTTLYRAGASFANIDLAREAARAADRNYDLMLDAYRRGAVSILDLLDAQTEALNARLDAANSVYVYLIDLMQVQRGVGQFDFFLSDTGRKAWFDKLDAFFRQQGATLKP